MVRTSGRREFLVTLSGALSAVVMSGWSEAEGAQHPVRRARRGVRRRVRRRIRRRLTTRMVLGRAVWVAPIALAVGWELELAANRVVVVKETRFVERAGARVEVVVVQGQDGKTEELEIVRENTPDNSKNLPGSVLPDSDKTTPGIEGEEDGD
jgi:hypothetical protein